MNIEEIAVELGRQGQDLKSHARRIEELEGQQKETQVLVRSVDKLAQSMESMVREQERQGKQIDALESSKAETFKYWVRTILTAVCTGLIGYALAFLINR
jgi:predicted transcriptional regulator